MPKTKVIVGFDTEDDGKGNPFLWCFTWNRGRTHFASRHDAVAFVERFAQECKSRGERAEFWATNLEYDLVNLFPRDRVPEVSFRFGRSFLCGASWRGADFRDTVRHLPASVAELGELVGLEKREKDLFSREERSPEAFLRRCMTDSAITYRAARKFGEVYSRFEQYPRMTLASTALAIWRDGFWKREFRKPFPEVYDLAFEAYHGGRTEAFHVGEFEDVTIADVASMYPWAMRSDDLPLPWGLYSRVRAGDAIEPFGVYRVQVESRLDVPRLPVRTDEGTIFPNGKWVSTYVGEELIAFARAGGKVRVLGGVVFRERCRPFDDYVAAMYSRKQAARGLDRTIYKLLLNGLYGKFGQRGRSVRAVPVERFLDLSPRPSTAREWNGLVIYSEDSTPPPWSNMVWPAFVTARARVKLADEIERVRRKGGSVYYCDTDSLIYKGGVRFPRRAREVGDFETRGRFRRLLLVGKKEYAVQVGRNWEAHAKGVPAASRFAYLTEGEATFQRPTRLREAARAGDSANVWREVTKRRRRVLKGDSTLGGRLPTPEVSGEVRSRT